MNRGVSSALEPLPFARIAQLGLAPRVRGLIEGIHNALLPYLDGGLERAVDALERDLLAHLGRTRQGDQQLSAMASLRELKRHRSEFVHACRANVQRSLLALVHPESAAARAAEDLAADSPREEQVMLAQVAARAEIRAGMLWQELGWRIGVIAGRPPFEIDALPVGPQQLCAALTLAVRRFDLDRAHRSALFRRIDKTLFTEAQTWAGAVNRYLIDHRVYANLKPSVYAEVAPAAHPRAVPAPSEAAPAASARPAVEPPAAAPAVATEPAPPPAASPPAAQDSRAAPPPAATENPPDGIQQIFETQGEGERRQMHVQASVAAVTPLDSSFFRSMRALVAASRRAAAPAEGGSDRERPLVQTADLLAALGELQRQPAAPVMVGGRWANRDVTHIRQDLLNVLRGRAGLAAPRLREEDQDVMDLVGLLFDRLLSAFPANGMGHVLMSRLQVPVLRVALQDPGFFPKRTHPARRLLGWLAEGLLHWVEDDEADRAVIDKLQAVVDRLLLDFGGRLEAFELALEEIERQLGALQKKAEIAERRHVEAARGREKLDLAQAAAEEAIRERIAGGWLPTALLTLLENAWVDAVALAMLRQGVDHAQTFQRLEVVDHLVDAFIEQRSQAARLNALDQLRTDLEEGLAAIGFHDDAIATAWRDVLQLVESPGAHSQAAAERAIDVLIRQRPRLGGETRGSEDETAWTGPGEAGGNAAQRAARAEIEQLPFGSWLEFRPTAAAVPLRRRLCWYSSVTGRCVLLGPRGSRHEDRSLDQLAREWASGRLRRIDIDHDQVIDHAWREIMATLRDARH